MAWSGLHDNRVAYYVRAHKDEAPETSARNLFNEFNAEFGYKHILEQVKYYRSFIKRFQLALVEVS